MRVAVVLLVLGALGGCRIGARVGIDVHGDGSGVVTVAVHLDRDAVRAAELGGAPLEQQVRLTDLPAAGWTVGPWTRRDGGASIVLRRPFATAAELTAVMRDLNGPNGPLRAVRLTRDRGPLRTEFDFHALADLAATGAGVAADQQLAANVAAQRVDVAALDAELTGQLHDALRFRVATTLPGGGTTVWEVAPGTRRLLAASSSQLGPSQAVWFAVAGVLAVGAVVVLVVTARRRAAPTTGT